MIFPMLDIWQLAATLAVTERLLVALCAQAVRPSVQIMIIVKTIATFVLTTNTHFFQEIRFACDEGIRQEGSPALFIGRIEKFISTILFILIA